MSANSLKVRSNQWSLVINEPFGKSFTSIGLYNTLLILPNIDFLAIICHEYDMLDNGLYKTKHFHLVLVTNKRMEKVSVIKYLCENLNVSEEVISCEKCNSLEGALRYLIHLDDPFKYQYDTKEVCCNNKEVFDNALTLKTVINGDIDTLYKVITSTHGNLLAIIKTIGLDTYKKYRLVINDLMRFYSNRL